MTFHRVRSRVDGAYAHVLAYASITGRTRQRSWYNHRVALDDAISPAFGRPAPGRPTVAAHELTDAQRLRNIHSRTGLTCEQLGEVLGASANSVHKLMSGRMQWCPLRVVILDALEAALRTATPVEVWGPLAGVTTLERLARVFAVAAPTVTKASSEGPVLLRPRRTVEKKLGPL